MLSLRNVSLKTDRGSEDRYLLNQVSIDAEPGQFVAIIGASGSGKSTLLKLIAGIYEPEDGVISWGGRNLVSEEDMSPAEIGYIPQFSIAYDFLTVWENVESAIKLRVKNLSAKERETRIQKILDEVGLGGKEDRAVRVLSGGEKRRLALAIELVGDPKLLLSDEVTSGLDPVSESDILELLHNLSRNHHSIVLNVTHSLQNLEWYDKVIIIHLGKVVYQGAPEKLSKHFNLERPEEVYKRVDAMPEEIIQQYVDLANQHDKEVAQVEVPKAAPLPNGLFQWWVLFQRRWKIFFRDKSQLWLQIGLIFGFPAVIVIFALNGLPQIRNPSLEIDVNLLQQVKEAYQILIESTKAGAIVSSLVMFQVVLLTLMASNNSAREITSERLILEKEKLAGLRTGSYLWSKVSYLTILVLIQSAWMTLFVKMICKFPGPLLDQMILLTLVNAAVTFICLAVSSIMKTSEQASIISIYFVGFQLPLSGAVLALPDGIALISRPFVSAYWSWSGYIMTMQETRLYDVVKMVSQTELLPVFLCFWVLVSHIIFGIVISYMGSKQSRWKSL